MKREPELNVELAVNGQAIELNEFVHKIIGNLLVAILNSLRLADQPTTAEFRIDLK